MELKDFNDHIKNIPENQREGVLNLIDMKTNDNLEKVLNAITHLENKVDTLESKMDTKINALEIKMDTKINALEAKISTIYWILGVIITLIIAMISKIINL